jgi:hypothetical protein
MKYTYGTIIAVAAALFFYLRLIILQRQKVKHLRSQSKKNQKRNQTGDSKGKNDLEIGFPKLEILSPIVLGISILMIIAGAVLSAGNWLDPRARELWWLPISVGIILMSFSIR